MRILGFDTATRATTVALLGDDGIAIERRDDPDPAPGTRPRHTTRLMPLIVEVMAAAGVGWDEIDRIAVGVGPGTLTGLRIGVATARALAAARSLELVGVSSLAALAAGAVEAADGCDAVAAVLDARRGEAFAAGWKLRAYGAHERLLAPAALAPDALAAALDAGGRRWLAVGDGAVEFRAVLEHSGARIPEDDSPLHRVSAVAHCRLARGLRPESPEEVRPQYLRLPDAELALRAARSR
jgi:tRNA threonylcarbamoyladenosine biosynthesis protein TsaB